MIGGFETETSVTTLTQLAAASGSTPRPASREDQRASPFLAQLDEAMKAK
jgi:hypothetical protein